MRTFKLVSLLVLVIALVVIVLQNRAPWQVHFLWLTGHMPGILLLFLTAAAGFVAGVIATLLLQRGSKKNR
ncbi:MAG: LapA family protein [Thermodesulfobacteriota bacterium]